MSEIKSTVKTDSWESFAISCHSYIYISIRKITIKFHQVSSFYLLIIRNKWIAITSIPGQYIDKACC